MTKTTFLPAAFLILLAGMYSLATAVMDGNRQPQPTPTPAPALVWRVTDTAGETFTYPESAGWGCVSGGSEGGAFRVECRRMADGREAERVELVAVRLEHVAAGGAE